MRSIWPDVTARARGLATHLLRRATLERLAAVGDLRMLATELARYGMVPAAGSAGALDLAVRRAAARRFAVLSRWVAARAGTLAVLLEDEDRRAIRAILRGVTAGLSPEATLAGVLPTPQLPERALAALAEQRDIRRVVALLAAWGHPLGAPLHASASSLTPDLFRVECALAAAYAARALRRARGGGPVLVGYARSLIDLENAWSALALARTPGSEGSTGVFLPGGARLMRPLWMEAAGAGDVGAAGERLRRAFHPSPLARAFSADSLGSDRVESEALGILIVTYTRMAREAPLGAAALVLFTLRVRAEVIDLRRVIWGAAFGVAAGTVRAALVTP